MKHHWTDLIFVFDITKVSMTALEIDRLEIDAWRRDEGSGLIAFPSAPQANHYLETLEQAYRFDTVNRALERDAGDWRKNHEIDPLAVDWTGYRSAGVDDRFRREVFNTYRTLVRPYSNTLGHDRAVEEAIATVQSIDAAIDLAAVMSRAIVRHEPADDSLAATGEAPAPPTPEPPAVSSRWPGEPAPAPDGPVLDLSSRGSSDPAPMGWSVPVDPEPGVDVDPLGDATAGTCSTTGEPYATCTCIHCHMPF